ncbi:hypothetical protein L2E82_19541 [Cichorium intybus]|uniref:Uncharacterized protein n=1 Tax=Cichorium intybus TaxID=13427 RepID=A0ACB9FCH9_CICIN|nr:hypothetical protein L2E82_19541 [Cichorium intybus]
MRLLIISPVNTTTTRVVYLLYPISLVSKSLGGLFDDHGYSCIEKSIDVFKGWHRLFQDCVGQEGPLLETICVSFAGLVILLWPSLVALWGYLCSMVFDIFQGLYAVLYPHSQLVEVDAHSLFSKWFSESGKMVAKLLQKIQDMVEEDNALVFVLIDEVESLAAVRKAALSGSEPSDSIRTETYGPGNDATETGDCHDSFGVKDNCVT